MIVLKFGGTSVGSATNIKKVAAIVNTYNERLIVVLSAVSGTTNALVKIHTLLSKSKKDDVKQVIDQLKLNYLNLLDALYTSEYHQLKALTFIRSRFEHLRTLTANDENEILAQGELISTHLFQLYLTELNIDSELQTALSFMSIDKNGEPETSKIKSSKTYV